MVGLSGAIQLEQLAVLVGYVFLARRGGQADRLLRRLERIREPARLGIGRRECAEEARFLAAAGFIRQRRILSGPAAQPAGALGQADGFRAVAQPGWRRGGPQPGQVVEGRGPVGLQA